MIAALPLSDGGIVSLMGVGDSQSPGTRFGEGSCNAMEGLQLQGCADGQVMPTKNIANWQLLLEGSVMKVDLRNFPLGGVNVGSGNRLVKMMPLLQTV